MDNKTANEMASRLYSATVALLGMFDDATDKRAISQEDLRKVLSMPTGKLSIASVETSGADRASRLATILQDNLFPSLP